MTRVMVITTGVQADSDSEPPAGPDRRAQRCFSERVRADEVCVQVACLIVK